MRSLFVVVGVLVVLLLVFSSGAVSGQLCVRSVGCLRGDDGGLRLDSSRGSQPPAARPAETTP